ncbi:MAG: AAA family ATPase, partial [Ilumatobacteraceae bacterium]
MSVIGRDEELAALAATLAAADTRSTITILHAEAGVGKTALLAAAVQAASDAGTRVLRCQPTQTEASLGYAALGDLLAPVTDLDHLDPVPRMALERALLRDRPGQGRSEGDARSVGVACAGMWSRLAADAPLLIVIDDVHWLDAASGAALAFSFRRLPERGVTVWCARRTGEPCVPLPGDEIGVPALGDDAVAAILRRRTASALSARDLRTITATAAGNPLFALELAAHRAARDGRPLSVPASLHEVIRDRFGAVAPGIADALAAAALLARPDLATIRRLGLVSAIEQAEADGLVTTDSGEVVFTHPLFAAAILDQLTPSAKRALHRRLEVATATDRSESIRHAGLAAEEPDRELADRLTGVADELAARGALENAADFAVLAAALSPADAIERPERYAAAAHLTFQRGEADGALRLLGHVDFEVASSSVRARALLIRSKVAFSTASAGDAASYATQALAQCTSDAERIEAHSILSRVSYDHFPTAAEHARLALELAERTSVPPAVLASALTAGAAATLLAGGGLDRQLYERAIELERDIPVYAADSAFASFAAMLKTTDELDEAREMLLALLAANEDEGALPYALSHLPQLELWAGNWDAAEDYANRHLDAATRTGQHDQVAQATSNLALVNTFRGAVNDAAALAEGLRQLGRDIDDAWTERNGWGLLGIVALANGEAEQAVEALARWHELAEQMGLKEPGYCRMQADHVEALVATGRIEAAEQLATTMQAEAERLHRTTLRAGASRARALVAAAQGRHADAVALATDAVELYAATPLVVEHARALLTLGQIHRRFKEKSAARANLQAALSVFERLGAERFAERARQDLARIGLRPPAGSGLTETERRVAELAATGKTVRQVGDELFISPKTVEANLTRVYRKLGLGGRAEL